MKKWTTARVDKEKVKTVAKSLGIPAITAQMLLVKGFDDESKMRAFLSDRSDFADPFLITDMDVAAERITDAIENEEKICIYGDYDADGVTSTSILYLYLKSEWADVMYYIPSREGEGYGMNKSAVDKLAAEGVNLIITVDNGISAAEEVDYANSLGIDVVVTDHHEPPETLPNAVAVVDPHRKDDESEFKHLCGAGVVLKLIMALESHNPDTEDILDRFAAICAIGTVADVVSLTGENRMIVKEGLRRINDQCDNLGINKLKELSGIGNKQTTAGDIGFILGPRINAGGRVDIALKAVEMLISDDEEKVTQLAQELCDYNDVRKSIEKDICVAARDILNANEDIRSRKIIVVAGEGWHPGVIGLAASRIRELYGKPTVVITYDGEKATGSARSVEGFPMEMGVAHCSSLLTRFGGHPMAAGMSLPTENIDKFRDMINDFADTVEDDFFPTLEVAAWLKPGTLTAEHVDSLARLEPYGQGNTRPVFGYAGVTIVDVSPLSNGKYTKVHFKKDNLSANAVCFTIAYDDFPYVRGDVVNIAVDVKINEYMGVRSVSSTVRDIMLTGVDNAALLESKRRYETYLTGRHITDDAKKELLPSRDDFAAVYRYLKSKGGFRLTPDVLLHKIGKADLTLGRLLVIVKALEQLSLIDVKVNGENLIITVSENPKKADLMSAPVLKGLV